MAGFKWRHILVAKGGWITWLIFFLLVGLIAADLTGRLDSIKAILDTEALTLRTGSYAITVYGILRAIVIIALVFWVTATFAGLADKRISRLGKLRPARRSLIAKIAQIAIYSVAFLIALDVAGLNLTTLTVLGGAVGIGIGFGLQKIASNFISGLILLLEGSIEENDLVELSNGTVGFIRRSSARYTLIETFDGKEILVPNEDLITSQVINWTLSSNKGRIEIPVGVAYGSDLEKVNDILLSSAREHPACITDPEPQCFLRQFGDSSVNFILLFWVEDVVAGRWGPQSDVMFEITRRFKDAGITIPFPQRDVHLAAPLPNQG